MYVEKEYKIFFDTGISSTVFRILTKGVEGGEPLVKKQYIVDV